MAEKSDKVAEQTHQQSSASGGSTINQILGDGNTLNIHYEERGGKVVAVHMYHVHYLKAGRPARVTSVEVNPGDTVQPQSPVISYSIPFGQAPLDGFLPSPVAGVVESLHVAVGDEVQAGHLIATVRVWDAK
jgi:biotin carboxyl carrier protein